MLTELPYELQAAVWVLGSVLLYVLGGLLLEAWPTQVGHPLGRLRRTLERSGVRFWSSNVLRTIFYLGLPYLALVRGAIELDTLGLGEVPSPRAVAWFLLIGAAGFLFLALLWSYYLRGLAEEAFGRTAPLVVETVVTRRWGLLGLFPEAVLAEAHWAFYRSLPYILTGGAYWAAVGGGALVAAETYLHPARRRGFGHAAEAESALFALGVAAVAATAYAVTGSAWLNLPLHLLLRWAVLRWLDVYRGRLAHTGAGRRPVAAES